MTLLGNFVRTSCHQKRLQTCKRRQRTLAPWRESQLCALQHLTDAHQVDGRRDGFGLQLRLGLSAIARAAQTVAANPFRQSTFDAGSPGIALLKRRGALFGPAALASLMHRLRGKGQDPPLVLLALGTERFDRTGMTGDGRKAHPYHLLASVVSSGAPVLRELSLGTTHLLLVPIHLESAHSIARLVLPSSL